MVHIDPAHDAHGDTGHKQTFILAVAGMWSIMFSLIIYLSITGWFIPNIRSDIPTAIISSVRIIGAISFFAIVHVGIQLALITNRPNREAPLWQKAFDYLTSFAPLLLGVILGHIMAARQYDRAYASWWIELRFWIDVIVCTAIAVDVIPTVKLIIFGRSSAADDDH